jgi:hypothetical protein
MNTCDAMSSESKFMERVPLTTGRTPMMVARRGQMRPLPIENESVDSKHHD